MVRETSAPLAASQPEGAEFMANAMTAPVGTRSVAPVPAKALAVMVPAEKLPEASRDTIAPAVLELEAVVAEFETFPAVEIVANLVSAMAAVAEMSASTITPGFNVIGIEMFSDPLKLVAVPVASPEIAIVRAV